MGNSLKKYVIIIKLFLKSLVGAGGLVLGGRESLNLSEYSKQFRAIDEEQKIYEKN